MIVEFADDLTINHVATQYGFEFVAGLKHSNWIEIEAPRGPFRLVRHEGGEVQAVENGSQRVVPKIKRKPEPKASVPGVANIETERAAVAELVDLWHARQFDHRFKLAPIHAVKASAARASIANGTVHPAIAQEAEIRGVAGEELCGAILARAAETSASVLDFDQQRLEAKRELARATTFDAIAAVRARFQNL